MTIDNFRRQMTAELKNFFENKGEDVDFSASNGINFPCLIDELEKWVVVTITIPKGTKTEEYDGYAVREEYKIKVANAEEKKKINAEKKAKKIEQDKKRREKKND